MQDNVIGRARDPRSMAAREMVHELITAHIYEDNDRFATVCATIVAELGANPALLAAYLVESAAYTHTLLSAIAAGLDATEQVDEETVALFHRAMIAAWAR